MEVRSVSESTDRYVRGCIRAYLEGKRDLRWITSIIGDSSGGLARADMALATLGGYGDAGRRLELMQHLAYLREAQFSKTDQ